MLTLSVPGICSSRTSPQSLKNALVVANDPMPSVSRKFAMNPTAGLKSVGRMRSEGSLDRCFASSISQMQVKPLTNTPSTTKSHFIVFKYKRTIGSA